MSRQLWIDVLLTLSFLILFAMSPDSTLLGCGFSGGVVSAGRQECSYTLNAGVRLIPFFWMDRSNVGGGRIVWTAEPDGSRGVTMVLGSDPERAPRRINRWGYIAERVSGPVAELTGVMTQSDEQSIQDAKTATDRSVRKHAFKGIRSRQAGGEARSTTVRMLVPQNYTYKDVAILLDLLLAERGTERTLRVPDGTETGLLFAVKGMVHETAERYRRSGEVSPPKPRQYVYNAVLYRLSMTGSGALPLLVANGREYRRLIESRFEVRNSATGKTTRFVITYGTEGPLSEIPVRIVYQPRWWFRVELLLDDAGAHRTCAQGNAAP